MTEYIQAPYAVPPAGYHIDGNFGREYDPYPDGRRRMTEGSWVTSPGAQIGSTPRLPPANVASPGMSPIPDVHRMDRSYDNGEMPRTPQTPHPFASPRPPLPGASHFREIMPAEPSRWTSPTNVSYPGSMLSGPPQRPRADTLSTFAPRHASTPAPERQGDVPPHIPGTYGVPDDESYSRLDYPEQESIHEIQHYDGDGEHPEGSESNDGDSNFDVSFDEIPTNEMSMPDSGSMQRREGRAKRFVGGFVSGFKHMPRFMSKGHSAAPPPAPEDPEHFAPQFRTPQPPAMLPPARSSEPPRIPSPTLSRSAIPSYANEDSIQSSNTASSQTGPATPNNPDIDLPNPHELRHREPLVIPDAESADLRPAADYDAMDSPIRPDYQDTTFSTQINRVGKFVTDFVHLPWISSHISTMYQPAASRRARYADKKPGESWYSKEVHEKLDLLASSPMQAPRRRPRPEGQSRKDNTPGPSHQHRQHDPPAASVPPRDAATAIRPSRTPGSITSRGGGNIPSPGASSHGQGHHSYSYSYHYPHLNPQAAPIVLYPAPVSPPLGQGREGLGGLPPVSGAGDAQQQQIPYVWVLQPYPVQTASPDAYTPRRHGSSRHQYTPQFPVPVIVTPPMNTSPISLSRSPPLQMSSLAQPALSTSPRQQPRSATSPRPQTPVISPLVPSPRPNAQQGASPGRPSGPSKATTPP